MPVALQNFIFKCSHFLSISFCDFDIICHLFMLYSQGRRNRGAGGA